MSTETEKDNSDEISLIDLFAVLWRRKWMIIGITLVAAIGVVVFCVISLVLPPETSLLPNEFTPKALMLIDNQSAGGRLSSMLGDAGGLAALAGINIRASTSYSELALFLVQTNSFLDAVVDEFNLIERYKIETSPKTKSRNALKEKLKAEFDPLSGVLTLSFTDIDPAFARSIVNFSTELLSNRFDEMGLDKNKIERENLDINLAATFEEIIRLEEESHRLQETSFGRIPLIDLSRIAMELGAKQQVYTQLMVQSELLRVNMASERPVFQILEMAEVPDQKSGPSRGLLCVTVVFAAGFFSVFLAFMMNFISNIKKDSEAMAKLRGTYAR